MDNNERQPADDNGAILDIGDDVGALLLVTGPEYRGREIEVSPLGEPAARVHTAVRERRLGDRTVFAGLYPALPAGTYRIWADRGGLVDEVTIVGGQVSEVDWTVEPGAASEATPGSGSRTIGPDVTGRRSRRAARRGTGSG